MTIRRIGHILFAFSLTVISCKQQQDYGIKPMVNNNSVVEIKLYNNRVDNNIEKIKLSEFIDSVKFVRLETKEESLISAVSSVIFVGEGIVIVDEIGKILLFDNEGNYIRKIANRGRGPGEYLNITSCSYNSNEKALSIYDDYSKKLLLYSTSGEFIKE